MIKTISEKSKSAAVCFLTAALLLMLIFPSQVSAASADYTADTTFTFSDSAIEASGSTGGYEIDGTNLKITAAGTYVITGSCAEGSITVKKETTGVTLVFKDLTLASSTTAPVSCNKSTEVQLILEGSSTLTDNEDPANEDSTDEETADAFEGAALKVKSGSSLTISGTGTLNADGSSCKNAVKSAATAVITVESGTVNTKSANNGLASDGSVVINGGTVNVTADNDGIKSEPDEDDTESAGTITINGGNIFLDVTGDGIQAAGDININGGTIIIEADDDAVNSESNINVTGGTLKIDAGDDAIHADSVLTIGTDNSSDGPDITVSSSLEGFEGAEIYMYSGSASITASDDGINAANSDLSNYSFLLDIEGGTWTINADGDGLDSNKDIVVNGGTTLVFGSVNNGNGSIDYEGSCTVNGGTLLCVGMSGMAMGPSSGTYIMFGGSGTGMGAVPGQSGQMPGMTADQTDTSGTSTESGSMSGRRGPQMGQQNSGNNDTSAAPQNMNMSGQTASGISINAGDTITIKDASGNTIIETTAQKKADNVMFAGESLVSGSSYTLYINGTEAGTAAAAEGTGMNGGMPGQNGDSSGQPQMPGQNGDSSGQPQMPGQNGDSSGQPQMPGQNSDSSGQPQMPGQNSDSSEQQQTQDQNNESSQTTRETDTGTVTGTAGFTDVQSTDWFAAAVEYVFNKQYMVGTSTNTFEPDTILNRAMMVQILYNYEGKPAVSDSASYSDVSDSDWFADAVAWAEDNNLIQGYGDGNFGAADALTREQAATILKRFAEYKGINLHVTADLSSFTDADQISDWAEESMKWAVGLNLINGTSATTLEPAGTATRAQMAQILMNMSPMNIIQ